MKPRALLGMGMFAAAVLVTSSASIGQRFGSQIDQTEEHLRDLYYVNPNPTPIKAPGNYRFSFVREGAGHEYLVHVPQGYHGQPMPMLIVLIEEDADVDPEVDGSSYKLLSKSDKAGFIAVFPSSDSDAKGQATWHAGNCCGPSRNGKTDDVGFIRDMIGRVERQVKIDDKRVFATGMSSGAMMTWKLACEAAEIRAIAPVAGTDNTDSCKPQRPVPIIEFHALDDARVPFNGGRGDRLIGENEFASVSASQNKWIDANLADPTPIRVLNVPGAHCDLHVARPGGAPVELCVTDTGGHSRPGRWNRQTRDPPSRAISANDLMWSFFSSL